MICKFICWRCAMLTTPAWALVSRRSCCSIADTCCSKRRWKVGWSTDAKDAPRESAMCVRAGTWAIISAIVEFADVLPSHETVGWKVGADAC